MRIENIPRFEALSLPQTGTETKTNEHGKTFQNLFNDALKDFNDLSEARREDRMDLLTGDLDDLHNLGFPAQNPVSPTICFGPCATK
jgi:flagellar hook-basal body complex protein FliE